jgi:hypothetical protein
LASNFIVFGISSSLQRKYGTITQFQRCLEVDLAKKGHDFIKLFLKGILITLLALAPWGPQGVFRANTRLKALPGTFSFLRMPRP